MGINNIRKIEENFFLKNVFLKVLYFDNNRFFSIFLWIFFLLDMRFINFFFNGLKFQDFDKVLDSLVVLVEGEIKQFRDFDLLGNNIIILIDFDGLKMIKWEERINLIY